ncbi:type II toxin-antitoxin system MqsR family toxin [Bacillus cereus]|uniref:type II toxin-antitoxin system MqsR family toxin n=1 Tax=Bacillus cereus TaxID=1396 RepID=UPI000BFD3060|nr:type II toxin-antitoxin system MqsR family toxin [Bacillus cereus]PGW26857.1 hypothetical protein COD88_15295 [Bacillus cereus]
MSLSLQQQLLEFVKKDQVKKFLDRLRKLDVTFTFDREDESRNRDTMTKLGLMETKEVYDIIRILEYTDYSSGPEENTSPYAPKFFKDGEVWKFGKVVKGLVELEVYIKVCFKEHKGKGYTACISFHEPHSKINYPLK